MHRLRWVWQLQVISLAISSVGRGKCMSRKRALASTIYYSSPCLLSNKQNANWLSKILKPMICMNMTLSAKLWIRSQRNTLFSTASLAKSPQRSSKLTTRTKTGTSLTGSKPIWSTQKDPPSSPSKPERNTATPWSSLHSSAGCTLDKSPSLRRTTIPSTFGTPSALTPSALEWRKSLSCRRWCARQLPSTFRCGILWKSPPLSKWASRGSFWWALLFSLCLRCKRPPTNCSSLLCGQGNPRDRLPSSTTDWARSGTNCI